MSDNENFKPDDFDEVYETYFEGIRSDGNAFADPSGWNETYSDAAELLPEIVIPRSEFGRYYLDEGGALGVTKDAIVSLIAAWEQRPVARGEVTLCHSISAGTFLILVALKRLGVRTIVFETPGYAVTMNQARYLGLRCLLVPSYRADNFKADLTSYIAEASPCAIWITQPRMSLGANQPPAEVLRILRSLTVEDYLVADEATEQEFSSVLRAEQVALHARLIRIRGITKGMGLNGLRLAFILHVEALKGVLEAAQEVCGGSLDLFSLRAAAALAEGPERFQSMLSAARRQTTGLRARAARWTIASGVTISPLVNGYMGSAWLEFDRRHYEALRRDLLSFCRARRTAVILSASMRFAFDPTFEAVRLNFFNREHHVLDGVKTLIDFAKTL